MANQKHSRSPSTSEKSVSSALSASAIKAGRKAKQATLKTVKLLTALLKRPCKRRAVPESDRKFFILIIDKDIPFVCIAETEPEEAVSSGGSLTRTLTHASSFM